MVPCASRAARLLHSAFVPRRPPDRAEGLRGARKPAATAAAPVAAPRSAYRIVRPPSTGRVTPVNDLAASERLLRAHADALTCLIMEPIVSVFGSKRTLPGAPVGSSTAASETEGKNAPRSVRLTWGPATGE